jgi:hypothetical protein
MTAALIRATCKPLAMRLASDVKAPRAARKALKAFLGHVHDTAELVLTELVTNAVRHVQGPMVLVNLKMSPDGLVIGVIESGRGLVLVQEMSLEFGWFPVGDSQKCVYAVIDMEMEDGA